MMMLYHSRSLPGECLFRRVDDRRLGELLKALLAQFGPDTGLLRAGVRSVWSEIEMLVHPDRAGIDPGRHLERSVAVRRPNRAAQAEVRVVGTFDHFVDVGVAQHRQHRAELFLAHQSGVIGDVADDGWLDEIALPLEHTAAGNNLAALPGILQETLDLFELRLVLDRAHLRA